MASSKLASNQDWHQFSRERDRKGVIRGTCTVENCTCGCYHRGEDGTSVLCTCSHGPERHVLHKDCGKILENGTRCTCNECIPFGDSCQSCAHGREWHSRGRYFRFHIGDRTGWPPTNSPNLRAIEPLRRPRPFINADIPNGTSITAKRNQQDYLFVMDDSNVGSEMTAYTSLYQTMTTDKKAQLAAAAANTKKNTPGVMIVSVEKPQEVDIRLGKRSYKRNGPTQWTKALGLTDMSRGYKILVPPGKTKVADLKQLIHAKVTSDPSITEFLGDKSLSSVGDIYFKKSVKLENDKDFPKGATLHYHDKVFDDEDPTEYMNMTLKQKRRIAKQKQKEKKKKDKKDTHRLSSSEEEDEDEEEDDDESGIARSPNKKKRTEEIRNSVDVRSTSADFSLSSEATMNDSATPTNISVGSEATATPTNAESSVPPICLITDQRYAELVQANELERSRGIFYGDAYQALHEATLDIERDNEINEEVEERRFQMSSSAARRGRSSAVRSNGISSSNSSSNPSNSSNSPTTPFNPLANAIGSNSSSTPLNSSSTPLNPSAVARTLKSAKVPLVLGMWMQRQFTLTEAAAWVDKYLSCGDDIQALGEQQLRLYTAYVDSMKITQEQKDKTLKIWDVIRPKPDTTGAATLKNAAALVEHLMHDICRSEWPTSEWSVTFKNESGVSLGPRRDLMQLIRANILEGDCFHGLTGFKIPMKNQLHLMTEYYQFVGKLISSMAYHGEMIFAGMLPEFVEAMRGRENFSRIKPTVDQIIDNDLRKVLKTLQRSLESREAQDQAAINGDIIELESGLETSVAPNEKQAEDEFIEESKLEEAISNAVELAGLCPLGRDTDVFERSAGLIKIKTGKEKNASELLARESLLRDSATPMMRIATSFRATSKMEDFEEMAMDERGSTSFLDPMWAYLFPPQYRPLTKAELKATFVFYSDVADPAVAQLYKQSLEWIADAIVDGLSAETDANCSVSKFVALVSGSPHISPSAIITWTHQNGLRGPKFNVCQMTVEIPTRMLMNQDLVIETILDMVKSGRLEMNMV